MKKPINTTKQADDNPLRVIMEAMIHEEAGTSHIGTQEAEGQALFVGSDTLPVDHQELEQLDEIGMTQEILESLGFEFLGPVEDDPLFHWVNFPSGWTKEPSDHSMWSYLIDPKGRKVASIFYKAAFYDRRSFMRLDKYSDIACPVGRGY